MSEYPRRISDLHGSALFAIPLNVTVTEKKQKERKLKNHKLKKRKIPDLPNLLTARIKFT